MNAALLSLLRCPVDYSADLSLEVRETRADDIWTATVSCPDCKGRYPVEEGVVRMLPPDLAASSYEYVDGQALKRSEMRARDEQVEAFDRLLPLNLFGLLEIPALMRQLSLKSHHALLEAGCGTGRMTPALSARCQRIVAVDYSWRSLLACRDKLRAAGMRNADLIQADICRLPLRSSAFDRILSSQVLEHVPSPDMRSTAVEELARVMEPHGALVISAYQHSAWTRLFGEKEGQHEGGIYFYRFTREELRRLLCRHLRVESVSGALIYHFIARCRKDDA